MERVGSGGQERRGDATTCATWRATRTQAGWPTNEILAAQPSGEVMRLHVSHRAQTSSNPNVNHNGAVCGHLRKQTPPTPTPHSNLLNILPRTRKSYPHLKYTLGGVLFSRNPTVSSSRSRIFRCWLTPSLAPSSTIKIRSEDLATAIT